MCAGLRGPYVLNLVSWESGQPALFAFPFVTSKCWELVIGLDIDQIWLQCKLTNNFFRNSIHTHVSRTYRPICFVLNYVGVSFSFCDFWGSSSFRSESLHKLQAWHFFEFEPYPWVQYIRPKWRPTSDVVAVRYLDFFHLVTSECQGFTIVSETPTKITGWQFPGISLLPMCAGRVGPCVPHVPMCSVVSKYFLPRCAVIGIDSIFGVFPLSVCFWWTQSWVEVGRLV